VATGHASNQIVFEVYGKHTEGFEQDCLAILRYYGRDFKNPGKTKPRLHAKAGVFEP
jgi:hypothetical protein